MVCFLPSGSEVAQYVSKKLPEVLKNSESYKKGEVKQSMVDCFLEVDQLIISDKVCLQNSYAWPGLIIKASQRSGFESS